MLEPGRRPSVADALAIIERAVTPLGHETVVLEAALGRLLAAAAYARIDMPRFAASAMDGFAVRSVDTRRATSDDPAHLLLQGSGSAGHWPEKLVGVAAAGISTGAPIPEGADSVIAREGARLVEYHGYTRLRVEHPVESGRNVRPIGEDARRGEAVLDAGLPVTPDAIGALASYGVDKVVVRRLPRVGLISTGTELVADFAALADPAAIIDSNAPMIDASLRALGLSVRRLSRVPDRRDAMDMVLRVAMDDDELDLVVSTGGVSAGDLDLIRPRLIEAGATILFHGVRMRPGKPLLLAMLPNGRPYFGLPGNPVAALVGFRFFVAAALRRQLGLQLEQGTRVTVATPPRIGTTLFLRGTAPSAADVDGIDTSLDQRSHVLRSVLAADRWVRLDEVAGEPIATSFPKPPSLLPC